VTSLPAAGTGLPAVAARVLDATLDRDPVEATYLGDHARDGLLPDPSAAASTARAAELRAQLAELDVLPPDTDPDSVVDAAVLRTVLAAELFEEDELREADWNPMWHSPGGALHALLSRDFAPVEERLRSLIQRLDRLPGYLAEVRGRLGDMPAVHVETARDQLGGSIALLTVANRAAAEHAPHLAAGVAAAAERAEAALAEQQRWLTERIGSATRPARIGPEQFRERLALTLDTAFEPAALLARAEAHLEATSARIVEHAGRLAGDAHPTPDTVRTVLGRLAADAPTDETVLSDCLAALRETTAFVRDHDLVTVHDDAVEVVAMPEIDRGVAVAYCRPNGPLEQTSLPTEMAVSPTPRGWSTEQVASFYREYNRHMLHNLTVHEAMPGHALQLMHSNRHRAATPVRSVWPSGSFVEGWAVYAEEVMADGGYRAERSAAAAAAVRMQQLKMQLRMTINAILDIRFHCDDLDERAALELMQGRGYQERGEADGKWRRVQLTSTQLCTYFVGYVETRHIADRVSAAHPEWSPRQRHDAMLSHGSPPPRHLRTLLGLPGDA
jgi:uncharacterized protein (DUF885 family)